MKKMQKIFCFSLFIFLIAGSLVAQECKSLNSIQKREQDIKNLVGTSKYITDTALTQFVRQLRQIISGTAIKEGKAVATSITIDDKGATLNWLLTRQPTKFVIKASFQGEAKDGFVTLFSEGKYSRKLSGGLDLQFFFGEYAGKYYKNNRILLHKALREKFDYLWNVSKQRPVLQECISSISKKLSQWDSSFNTAGKFLHKERLTDADILLIDGFTKQLELYKKTTEELGPLITSVFGDTTYKRWWRRTNYSEVQIHKYINHLKNCDTNLIDYCRSKLLDEADSIQINASRSRMRLQWFNISPKINREKYELLDVTSKESLYTQPFIHHYFSIDASINFFWQTKNLAVKNFVYPTLSFFKKRDFNEKDKIRIQKMAPYMVGNDTVFAIKETAFYEKKAALKPALNLELPYNVIFAKKIGFDIALATSIVPNIEDVTARLGVFIPIIVDDNTIVIEPLIRLNKLEQSKKLHFFKDQVEIGFNVSVALPKFMAFK